MEMFDIKVHGVVYLVVNHVTTKCYVGQTHLVPAKLRWEGHLRTARRAQDNHPLYSALRKYGEKAFTFGIIYFAFNQAQLDQAEIYYIDLLNTKAPYGYNLKGGGVKGRHSEISLRQLKATLAKPEVKALRIKRALEVCAKPEVKLRKSLSQRRTWNQPHMRVKRGKVTRKFFTNEEIRLKHKLAIKAVVSQPEVKARHLAAILEAFARPETKLKRSIQRKELIWINNGVKNRRINRHLPVPPGWVKGRKSSKSIESLFST